MADADTAVLELDNGASPEAPERQAAESAEGQIAADSNASETTETEGTSFESPWAGKTPEEIDAEVEKRLRDVTAKAEEKYRQKLADAQQKAEQKLADAQQKAEDEQRAKAFEEQRRHGSTIRQGRGLYELQGIAKALENGRTVEELAHSMKQVVVSMEANALVTAQEALVESANRWLDEHGLTLKPEHATKISRAANVFNHPAQAKALLDAAYDSIKAQLSPTVRKEVEAELAEKAKTAAEAAKLAEAGEARQKQDRPAAGLNGTSTSRGYTLQEIDEMPTNQWLAIPKAERDRLLEDAHARAGSR